MQIISAARRSGKSKYARLIQQSYMSDWPHAETTCIRIVPNKIEDKEAEYVYTYAELIRRLDLSYQTVGVAGSLPAFDYVVFEEPGGSCGKHFKTLMQIINPDRVVLIIGTPTGDATNGFDEFLMLNTNNVIRWSMNVMPKDWDLPEDLIRTQVHAEYEGL